MIHNVDPQLSQWDVGRSVKVTDSNATHIHFANKGDSKAVIIEIKEGSAKIPDYLLQTGKTVIAYAVQDGVTLEVKSFAVRKRERPENYVYDDDQRNYIYVLITNAETATVNANQAAELANEAADKALKAAESWVLIGDASGETITVDDAIKQPFAGFRIFGKTTQDGTPTPDAPVELVSAGDSGSITVNVDGENEAQSMTIATPNGLPGIPVASGGNYTDSNGQQWICDEIDFGRRVYIRRVNRITLNGKESWTHFSNEFGVNQFRTKVNDCYTNNSLTNAVSSHFAGISFSERNYNYNTIYTGAQSPDNFIYVNIDLYVAPTEFAALLAENPVDVLYRLATPIETPLSEEQLSAYASLHTYRKNTTVSNDATAYMEIEYFMDGKKYIDSVIGTGGSGGAAPAKITWISLPASKWVGADSLYSQVVTIAGVTPNSKVDLLPSVEQLAIFYNKDVTFVTENEGGVVTVYAIGEKPVLDYAMQAQITEVEV